MRGGALPPALLCAALGFALALGTGRTQVMGLMALGLAVLVFMGLAVLGPGVPPTWTEAAFLGCWASVILAAAAVHLPGGVGPRLGVILGLNTGVWTGAVVSVAGAPLDLIKALPCALLCLPAGWLVSGRRQIVVKVAASWLIAVAVLAVTLSLTTPTPGYMPDHMD